MHIFVLQRSLLSDDKQFIKLHISDCTYTQSSIKHLLIFMHPLRFIDKNLSSLIILVRHELTKHTSVVFKAEATNHINKAFEFSFHFVQKDIRRTYRSYFPHSGIDRLFQIFYLLLIRYPCLSASCFTSNFEFTSQQKKSFELDPNFPVLNTFLFYV